MAVLLNEIALSTLLGALGMLIGLYIALRRVQRAMETLEAALVHLTTTLDALRAMN